MSVIQKIQEKYAKLMAIIIAVALMIFVVMLAFENGGSLFRGGNSNTVGKVNGTSIDYTDFMKKVEQQEKNIESQYAQMGMPAPSGLQQQAIESAWSLEVNDILQQKELDKLSIRVGKKEMGDILYGPNAPDQWKRLFMRSDSDRFDGIAAKAQIDQMLKAKALSQEQADQREQLIAYINSLQQQRLDQKLTSLLSNSVNFPKWFIEKQIADESQMASISVVRDNVAEHASDSTIKVSDKEIQDYIDKHKEDYKQEESRSIAYVSFSTKPSTTDSVTTRNKLVELKQEFGSTQDIKRFLAAQGVTNFYDGYINGKLVQIAAKDTIFKTPVDSVYGPYLDGNSYALAKVLGVRQQPDTVKVRHILISTTPTSQSAPARDSVSARKLIDSIQIAIRNGSSFDSLVKLSDDNPNEENAQRGKYKGGIYDRITAGGMVPSFNDFIFNNPVGTKGVVKTEYGYHYIEILSQKGNSPAYKIAYLSRPIESSTETEINANNDANQFAANSRDQKSFDANAEKLFKERGIGKMVANEIKPSAQQVPGLNQPRALVRNVYKAKLGEVLEPQKAGDSYVVAIVTEINKEGTQSVAKARPGVDPLLRNKKIAEKIIQKIGNITTLEAAAAALGGKPIEQADSLRMIGAQGSGAMKVGIASEPKVIGAAFNPSNKGKVVPQAIEGRGAVYVVRVNDVSATSVANANVAEIRKMRYVQGKQQVTSPIQALRETATIKDRRVNFF